MKHLKYEFIENTASGGMVVFRGGGVSALIPPELKFDALSVLFAYANCDDANNLAHEILRDELDNPFFGMPSDKLRSLAMSFKKEIAVPWRYRDIDVESNFSAVLNLHEPLGCMPVITVKGTNPVEHLAILAAFNKITELRAKLLAYDDQSQVILFRSEKNIPFFGFHARLDSASKCVRNLILNRKSPVSFIFAIPSNYDLWSAMRSYAPLPDIKLLDYCLTVPVFLTRAVVSKSNFSTWKASESIKDIIKNSGQVMNPEDLAAVS